MPDPVRVLQVLGRSAGGIARHVAQVTEGLDGEGLLVDIAGPPDLPVTMPKRIIEAVIPDGPFGHREAVARLQGIIRDGGYGVVHAHGLRAGIDAGLAARRRGVPPLMTVHNLVRPDVSGRVRATFYNWAEPLAVRLNCRTFAVSRDIAEHLEARIGVASERIELLYLGAGEPPAPRRSGAEVRDALGVGPGGRLVVTVARLSAQKAIPVMLRALALLPREVVLAVVGQGPDELRLRTEAAALGVDRRVVWLGWRGDVADHLAAADVFCLSSNWEGIPLAAQEAIALGTPVVATDVGGMSELVEDRTSGRLVAKGDARALSDALDEVLFSDERAAGYAAAARQRLHERFSTERMLDRLRQAYREHAT